MSVRLNKVTKEFNIGLQTAVEFLQKKGYAEVEANPNYKISDEQFNLLQQEFSTDKGLRTEAKMLIQQRQGQTKERKKPAPVIEEYVEEKPRIQGPKILGQIDLEGKKQKPEEVKPQPEEVKAAPVEEAPQPEEVKPEPVVEEVKLQPEETSAPEAEAPVAEPEVEEPATAKEEPEAEPESAPEEEEEKPQAPKKKERRKSVLRRTAYSV